MGSDAAPLLSAQVILASPATGAAVAEFFGSAGLEVGPLVGSSFAISGPRSSFEAALGSAAAERAGAGAAELPLDSLPADLAAEIEAIAVGGQPDFGPPP